MFEKLQYVCLSICSPKRFFVWIKRNAHTHTRMFLSRTMNPACKRPPHGSAPFDGELGRGEPEEGAQIKEWGGVSLWVARKQPPVILLARQTRCRLPSNTVGDLHIFRHTHAHRHTRIHAHTQPTSLMSTKKRQTHIYTEQPSSQPFPGAFSL